jgi:hypothetical protein
MLMSEVDRLFFIQYYQSRINYYNSTECNLASGTELLKIAAEASALRKILLDASDEGYADFVGAIIAQTNALEQLQHFLTAALARLGPPSEKERFYLYPELVRIDGLNDTQFGGGTLYELEDYISKLDHESDSVLEIAHCFESAEQRHRWQAKTKILMTELAEFLVWIVRRLLQQPDAVPVLMLRDTLLIYFGLTWLHQRGLAIPRPRPIFFSRKFASSFESGENAYERLGSDVLYGILYNTENCDLLTLRELFVSQASRIFAKDNPFVKGSRACLDGLSLNGSPFVIESGWQGTFPLWLLTLTNNVGDFVLYTTSPWMYPIYQDIVFRKNYNYLRDMETIVAQEHLFQFSQFRDGLVIVEETRNPIAPSLARYELHLFKQLVEQKMREIP